MSRRYSSSHHAEYRPRSESRTDTFLNAIETGHFRDAVGALRPGRSRSRASTPSRHHHERHYFSDRNRSRGYDDDDDYYYYSDDEKPRHHHHHRRSSHVYAPEKDYYYADERPHRRGRSAYTDSYSASDRTSRSRPVRQSHSVGPDWSRAAKAAVTAGLVEGWRSRHRPGNMSRILTAAAGAAAVDALIAKHGDRNNTGRVARSTVSGLMLHRIVNGSSKRW